MATALPGVNGELMKCVLACFWNIMRDLASCALMCFDRMD